MIESAAEGSHFSGLTMAGGLCHTVTILHYRWLHGMVFLDTDAFFVLFSSVLLSSVLLVRVSKMFHILENKTMNKKSSGKVSSLLRSTFSQESRHKDLWMRIWGTDREHPFFFFPLPF